MFDRELPFVTQITHNVCGAYIGRYAGELHHGTVLVAERMRYADGSQPIPGTRCDCPSCGYAAHAGNARTEKVLLLTYNRRQQ